MNKVKLELGREAVILHTRRFKTGGMLGLFGNERVEVMAAVDDALLETPAVKNSCCSSNADCCCGDAAATDS